MEKSIPSFDVSNFRDILTVLFKYKYLVLLTFLFIFVFAIIIAFITPKTYEGKSIIMFKFGREFLTRPEVGSGSAGSSVQPETIMRGEIAILTSHEIKTKAINAIGLQRIYPGLLKNPPKKVTPLEAAIENFNRDYHVSNVSGTTLIAVSFTHTDPYVASEVVNTIVDAFKDKHLEVFSSNSTPFLESQKKAFQEKLKASESNLADFKQKSGVFSLEEQRSNLISQRGTLDTTLKTTQIQISELEQKLIYVKGPKWVAETPADMRSQLATLQQRERELLERYTENSRAVQNLRQEIQTFKSSMKQGIEDLRQAEFDKTQSELVILKTRADSIRKQLGQIEGEIRTLDAHGNTLQGLRREATGQEQNYQAYANKLEESVMMDDMDRRKMVAISVVEKAFASMVPKKQKLDKKRMIGAGLLGGIAIGIALAFFLEFMSHGMTTPMSAEKRLGLPVMVAITNKE